MGLAEKVIEGDVRSAARLMRDIDDEQPQAIEELKRLHPYTGKAYFLGITGPPGTGKSTLVDQLIGIYREDAKKVGIVLVDPTSPFSGGALLGDRIRMQQHSSDEGVFIRSLATRGAMGGLSRSALQIARVLDAMGKDLVILETVGVGQDEVDIARVAHTTIVVLAPGLGDDIQAIKAGILEIADILVVNKADREGAHRTLQELQASLNLREDKGEGWQPPILLAEAINAVGIKELVQEIERHKSFLQSSREIEKRLRRRVESEFFGILGSSLTRTVLEKLAGNGRLDRYISELLAKKRDPYSLAEEIVKLMITKNA